MARIDPRLISLATNRQFMSRLKAAAEAQTAFSSVKAPLTAKAAGPGRFGTKFPRAARAVRVGGKGVKIGGRVAKSPVGKLLGKAAIPLLVAEVAVGTASEIAKGRVRSGADLTDEVLFQTFDAATLGLIPDEITRFGVENAPIPLINRINQNIVTGVLKGDVSKEQTFKNTIFDMRNR